MSAETADYCIRHRNLFQKQAPRTAGRITF